ncbi:hypothetical protein [Hamadaea tsunoensis]|uniref:hypothetical protein n=1 Tax=Hamadaea tsunoensis TaxID=53368 RepID=UPI0012F750E7|nr:hypothetical protein [Hamadaea tsunoensis]
MQPAALSDLVRRASDLGPAAAGLGTDRLLPVASQLRDLLPGYGLRRGSTVAVAPGAPGTTSLLLALLAEASRAGSWCAVVGVPALGLLAASELGIALDRFAVVPHPGPEWPAVAATLLDGFDLVVVSVKDIAASVCAQLAARARQRGSVLVPFGSGWDGAEVTLSVTESRWYGVGEGSRRRITVAARGRGAAARPRRGQVWLPGPPVEEETQRLRVVR